MKDEIKTEADLLIRDAERKQRLECEADRPFTKMLFGLWLILVLILLVLSAAVAGEDRTGHSQFLIGVMFWMVIITGAYTFQEVRRLHKRIDAIRRLEEKDHRTRD